MSTQTDPQYVSARPYGALLVAIILTMGMVTAPSTQAFAQSEEVNRQVEKLSEQAFERYGEKDYEGAIDLFKQAYELHPVPNLLYNMARCYEKKQDWEEAIDYYEQFIVAPDIDTDDRKSALERIEKLREIQDAQEGIKEDPEKKDPDQVKVVPPPEVEEPDKGPSKVPGAVLLGVGIAALGTGGYFGFQASNTQSEFDAAQDVATRRDAQQRGQRQALIADGLYAGGAIFSVIGTVLLVRASKKSEATSLEQKKESPGVTFVSPSLGKGYGGVSMGLTF